MKSSVSISYLAVVLIWSTTPLGIVWSSESVHPTMAVLLRMVIAVVLGLLVIYWKRIEFPWHRTALRLYAFSAMGIFGGMLLVYMAANYIASGTISLIFGLAPIVSGFLAVKFLNEPKFSPVRKLALGVSLIGLGIVFSNGLTVSLDAWPGYVFILFSVFFFCLSAVLVKTVKIQINPTATTVGALIFTLPFFLLAWLLMDGTLPYESWGDRAIYAILYLGIFGSFIGFVAYYYILQKLPASTVALITLMTPILALIIGAVFNQEDISIRLMVGAGAVMLGLGLYHFGEKAVHQKQARLSTKGS